MRRRVDHAQRVELILKNAQKLFGELGYPRVTLKLLSKRCNLSRTVIYRYYSSKRKVFEAVVYRASTTLGVQFLRFVQENPTKTACEKLRFILYSITEYMEQNAPLLDAVVEYLIDLQRKGESVSRRVSKHTALLRLSLFRLIREGMNRGEFQEFAPGQIAGVFYEQLMGAALQIAVTNTHDPQEFRNLLDLTLYAMKHTPTWKE